MRTKDVEMLMNNTKSENINYKKAILKEYFIKKALFYIYKESKYWFLTFNWWTCLRILYDLPRLSEDIDMDILENKSFDIDKFWQEICNYFSKYIGKEISYSIKSMWRTILIKIPILRSLWFGDKSSDSDLLYIKFDIQNNDSPYLETQVSPYMKDWLYFMIKHYNLPTLFSNKIKAIFWRWEKVYKDVYPYKWRDYFDLIRYLQKNVKPNFKTIQNFLLNDFSIDIKDSKDLIAQLDKKIESIDTKWIYEDINWLIEDMEFAQSFLQNFKQMYYDLRNNML